jgi:hypothetical protein
MMGHYRSEMGFENEDDRREKEHQRRVADLTKIIEAAIERKGVARMLAEFIEQNGHGGYCYLRYQPE